MTRISTIRLGNRIFRRYPKHGSLLEGSKDICFLSGFIFLRSCSRLNAKKSYSGTCKPSNSNFIVVLGTFGLAFLQQDILYNQLIKCQNGSSCVKIRRMTYLFLLIPFSSLNIYNPPPHLLSPLSCLISFYISKDTKPAKPYSSRRKPFTL